MGKGLGRLVLPVAAWLALGAATATAGDCPGNPNALGTSRTIVVDPREHARIGAMNYPETLPLRDKEVVLTFDDGPLPPYTDKILAILAKECVHATYFIVGAMARAYPDALRRVSSAGHTIGTHSMSHPIPFRSHGLERTVAQIDDGIKATAAALGDPDKVAPFFRFPGLGRTDAVEDYLVSRGVMAWSADFPADDWRRITASEIAKRALRRLEAMGRGILLLHDIHPATVLALPTILQEMKARGYRIVHVVPATAERPKTPTTARAWLLHQPPQPVLPVFAMGDVLDPDGESLVKKSAAALCSLRPQREPPIKVASRRHFKRHANSTQLAKATQSAKPTQAAKGTKVATAPAVSVPDVHAVGR
jgi:peptidoglycan/xylan/chitin deacetylase (PgdA/CDA1 family)